MGGGGVSENEKHREVFGLKNLVNTLEKKISLFSLILFGFLSLSDLSVIFFEPPNFNDLEVAIGKINYGTLKPRYGRQLSLVSNDKKLEFSCELRKGYASSCQFDKKTRQLYQGQQAKIWWYKTSNFGWIKDNRLYQLEVDRKIVIPYEYQKQRYLKSKKAVVYFFLIGFILSVLLFCYFQFGNYSPRRAEE